MRRSLYGFLLLSLAGAVGASEPPGCGQSGDALADVLWEQRHALLMRKHDLEDQVSASARPKLSDVLFFDRVTVAVGYGNYYNWLAPGITEPYKFDSDKRTWSGEIKYSIPLNAFRRKGPSSDRVAALHAYAADRERAEFEDLVYDLRIALAERDAEEDDARRGILRLKARKIDAKIRNLTGNHAYMLECIR